MLNLPFNIESIFSIDSDEEFNEMALKLFHWQVNNIEVYKEYVISLGIDVTKINSISAIPYLPIQFFKSRNIIANTCSSEIIFKSSGTTDTGRSEHHVADISLYEKSFKNGFKFAYGADEEFCIIALLPNYQEQGDSSLIYMVDALINESGHSKSGFYLDADEKLYQTLDELKKSNTKTILLGVTYALLDFIENHSIDFKNLIVMETGGMKGRRKEIVREELHSILCKGFGVAKIHSEYGMTELLSQGYSKGDGIFSTPPWMKIITREVSDPLTLNSNNKTGGINIIDLANAYSCAFIATQDLGQIVESNNFTVIGRFDSSDTRGCNLMIQ